MNWQAVGNFVVASAPYIVALAIGIGSWIWGRSALKLKDDLIGVLKQQIGSQKDLAEEVKQAKDAHIQTLEQLRPARLQEDLAGLHKYYADLVDRTQQQAEDRVKELEKKHNPEERKKLEQDVVVLKQKLAEAEGGRQAAERLARDRPWTYGLSGTINAGKYASPLDSANWDLTGEVSKLLGTPSGSLKLTTDFDKQISELLGTTGKLVTSEMTSKLPLSAPPAIKKAKPAAPDQKETPS